MPKRVCVTVFVFSRRPRASYDPRIVPVIQLTREVRFSIDRDWVRGARGQEGFASALPVTNSFAGWPSAVGIAPYLVLRATLEGPPDPVTGYLVNIRRIDALLREVAIPMAARRLSTYGVLATGELLVREIWAVVQPAAPSEGHLVSMELQATPHLKFRTRLGAVDMVEITQSFEFSAAHRLHVAAFSDEQNRETFGKCNNLNGHGHNYVVDVTIAGTPDPRSGCVIPLPRFESIVKERVIDTLDHKHLNADTREFSSVNPTVENIAIAVWNLLHGHFAPAQLACVRVWETPKTFAEYRGQPLRLT